MRQAGLQHVMVPALPTAGLVMIQANFAFAFFKRRLNRPAQARHAHQFRGRTIGGRVAQEVFDFGRVGQTAAKGRPLPRTGQAVTHRCHPQKDKVGLQRATAASGVVVLGISIDKNPKLYQKFLKRFQVSFQTARDPEAEINASYGTFKVPETYIIDKSGKVVQKVVGERNWNDPEIIGYVKSLM